jgi:hypothetical protein
MKVILRMKEAQKTEIYVSEGGYLCIKQHETFNEPMLVLLTIEQLIKFQENINEFIQEIQDIDKMNEDNLNADSE